MRNLKLQYCREQSTGVANAKQIVLQPDNEITFFVTDNKICAVNNENEKENASPKTCVELPDIVAVEYLQLENALCVATGAGEVVVLNAETLAPSEGGTYCDVGIERMAWSPNQEVVAFITKTKQLVVMTCTYDVLVELPLDAQLGGDQQFVNVGWGKKETQFHGTAGKQAAKQSDDFVAPQDVQQLPQDVHIAWRGDGAYFAVSFVAAHVGRTFSVYDNEGKLQHTAERWNGLQSPIAWRPSGNWIAQPQIFENKSTVALFEKNGLRHREFVLPFDLHVEPIVQLSWSADSDILALQTLKQDAGEAVQSIYLYTIGNYHWYLKQVLVYKDLAQLHWDNRLGAEHVLHVLLKSGKRYTHRWHYAADCQPEGGIVAVIDGRRLLLTDFNRAVLPPPMCWRAVALDSYINAISMSDSFISIFTSDHRICEYSIKCNTLNKFKPVPQLAQIQLANFNCIANTYVIGTHAVEKSTHIFKLQIGKTDELSFNVLKIAGTVNALAVAHKEVRIFVQTLDNGHIYKIIEEGQSLKLAGTFLKQTHWADQMAYHKCSADTDNLITLRSPQLLHYNGQSIADNVTSFCVLGEHLCYTQLNLLHIVRVSDLCSISTRNIERGAKLVTCIKDATLVLQLPRGNLEVISPRVLVLRSALHKMSRGAYNDGIMIMRKHRINLNIICDHDVPAFVNNVNRLLSLDSNDICLFLSELQNEDYSLGMYAGNYDSEVRQYPPDFSVDKKVDYICKLLCSRMEERDKHDKDKAYRLPILTGYVKMGRLEQALQLIWLQRQTDALQADKQLKYLLYLADVNELYTVALGTYDLGLVLYVAQKSQKDPKEFLPYLNELKALPADYRKFKIDEHLKRYERALPHLAASGEQHHDLALNFIKQHSLFSSALVAFAAQPAFHRRVCIVYADHLRANAQLEAASLMYERGGQLQQALLSARHTLDWRRVLLLAQRTGEPLEQVAHSLVESLQQKDRHLEAYELLKRFAPPDSEAPLKLLLQGHLYGRAIYEAAALGDADLLEKSVKPSLIAYVAQLEASLSADRQLFVEHKERLLHLRKSQARSVESAPEVEIEEWDLLSDTSSVQSSRHSGSSRGSGKSFRSSKNRRKHERKLLSLKPGNPFEDIALIDALHNQVTKLAQQQQQQLVRDTCTALLQLHTEDARAATLQQHYATILREVLDSLDEIWVPELMGGTAQHLTGPNVDYLALQKEQRYALIAPLKRFKPQLTIIDWKHGILH